MLLFLVYILWYQESKKLPTHLRNSPNEFPQENSYWQILPLKSFFGEFIHTTAPAPSPNISFNENEGLI